MRNTSATGLITWRS